VACIKKKKNANVVLGTTLKEKTYLEDLGVDERIIK
jgi:hypothetical protein